MSWWIILLLALQAAMAVAGLRVLVCRVFPALPTSSQPEIVADVWGPLAVAGPLLFLVGQVDVSVQGSGWGVLGGPACLGLIGAGAGVAASAGAMSRISLSGRLLLTWAGTGLVLVMLGAAHDLTVWIGQCVFALAAVVMWVNTPHTTRRGVETADPVHPRAGSGLGLALLLGAGQGTAALLVSGPAGAISRAMLIAYAGGALAGAARSAGPNWAIRLAGWSATIVTLFGIGLISLVHLIPEILGTVRTGEPSVSPYVAHSFGTYSLEAMLMVLMPALAMASGSLPRRGRIVVGSAAIFTGAVLAAWRISGS